MTKRNSGSDVNNTHHLYITIINIESRSLLIPLVHYHTLTRVASHINDACNYTNRSSLYHQNIIITIFTNPPSLPLRVVRNISTIRPNTLKAHCDYHHLSSSITWNALYGNNIRSLQQHRVTTIVLWCEYISCNYDIIVNNTFCESLTSFCYYSSEWVRVEDTLSVSPW